MSHYLTVSNLLTPPTLPSGKEVGQGGGNKFCDYAEQWEHSTTLID